MSAPPLPAGFLDRPFAHRGLHGPGAPENSAAAVAAAIAAGYGIEVDLQPSADRTPMVFHDATLDRMTGVPGRIADHSARDLATTALCGGDGAGIPTLAKVLRLVAGRVPLLIELKDQTDHCGLGPETLEPATARLLSAYRGPVAVMSFNPNMVASLARYAPQLPRGLTTCAFSPSEWPNLTAERARRLGSIADAEEVGASFISHDHRDLRAPPVADQRQAGRAILCWTVRTPEDEAAALRHADAITFEGYRPA